MTKKIKKVKSASWFKRAAYLGLVAVPALLIFRNKEAVATVAAVAYDKICDASAVVAEHVSEQAEALLDKAKEYDLV